MAANQVATLAEVRSTRQPERASQTWHETICPDHWLENVYWQHYDWSMDLSTSRVYPCNGSSSINVCKSSPSYRCGHKRAVCSGAANIVCRLGPRIPKSVNSFCHDSAALLACSRGTLGSSSIRLILKSSAEMRPRNPRSTMMACRISLTGRYAPRSCSP